jgi:tripartite-type tricarboxylate transporter receptor subunit TctC
MPTFREIQRQRLCPAAGEHPKLHRHWFAAACCTRRKVASSWSHAMKLPRRYFLHLAAGAAALPVVSRTASALDYPSRPITMIVPFPPGGLTDVLGRVLAAGMQTLLGQSVVVENVGGADGSIGTGRAARAAPDGYTMVLGIWNTHVANAVTYRLDYDVVKDFAPIALCAEAPLVLIAKKTIPAHDLPGYIAWLKANPDKATMATVGVGSPVQLLGLLMQKETGARFTLVPYRGAGPAVQDLVAGQIDMTFANTATALPFVRAGSIKALGVTSLKRIAAAPDIPTMDEAGLRGFSFSLWAALFAPRDTPADIIAKLNAAAVNTLHDASVHQKLEAEGFVIPPRQRQTPAALGAYQQAEIEKWWPIIKAAGIKVQ